MCVHYVPASFQPALLLIASSTHPTPSAFAPPRDRVAAPWGESLQMTWVDGWWNAMFLWNAKYGKDFTEISEIFYLKSPGKNSLHGKQKHRVELSATVILLLFWYSILSTQTMDLRWCAAVGQSSTRRNKLINQNWRVVHSRWPLDQSSLLWSPESKIKQDIFQENFEA